MTTTPEDNGPPPEVSEADIAAMHDDPRFVELKRTLFRFTVPVLLAALAWYLVYVLLSAYARDFMGIVLFGNINLGLVLGLSQFAVTFYVTWAYNRFTARKFDTQSAELRDDIMNGGAK
ncbi:DUF485 domain-containing protein [Glycomyces mayteni]|uniref:DUF485 domain-containing protein n=1 Tax=Glycomyces mayteni TaxID=543887 RepID=A0ABW2D536_9ACTN|nr:DUF485 domain-containing protein [Glycomyces mayteni]